MDEKMMLFLGTGAAEGIPTPFCRCRVCENARKKGGKEVRMRSSFRVSRELLIDLGPDLFSGCVKTGTDLYDLKYVLITHTHEDHLDIGNLFLKPMIHRGNGEKLHIYLNGEAFRFWSALEDRMEYEKREAFFKESLKENFVLHRLEFYIQKTAWQKYCQTAYGITTVFLSVHACLMAIMGKKERSNPINTKKCMFLILHCCCNKLVNIQNRSYCVPPSILNFIKILIQ